MWALLLQIKIGNMPVKIVTCVGLAQLCEGPKGSLFGKVPHIGNLSILTHNLYGSCEHRSETKFIIHYLSLAHL